MIKLNNILKVYETKKEKTVALDNVSLEVEGNGLIFVLGKSGSGKSTLINLIAGLDKANKGTLIVNGYDVTKLKRSNLDCYRNSVVSCVFQEYNLLDDYTVYDNLQIAAEFNHKDKEEINKLIDSALSKVDMQDYALRKPTELSGGQRQRVAIARALVKQTPIIVLDEPTGALDTENAHNVMDILKELAKDKQIIVVSHDRKLCQEYADRIIELEKGKIISDSNEKLEKTDSNIILHKPKLPILSALKFALKSLKVKPYKLVATLLISIIAFSCFGVVDTMASYNYKETLKQSIINNNIDVVSIMGTDHFGDIKDNKSVTFNVTEKERQFVEKSLNTTVDAVLNKNISLRYNYTVMPNSFNQDNYYDIMMPKAIMMSNQRIEQLFKDNYIGNLPANDNEIMITKYIYEHFKKFGYQNLQENSLKLAPHEVPDISRFLALNPTLDISGKDYNIVGVIDTKLNSDGRYETLKNSNGVRYDNQEVSFRYEIENSYHNLVFFRENTIKFDKNFYKIITNKNINIENQGNNISSIQEITNEKYAKEFDIFTYRFDGGKGLNKGEILINASALYKMNYSFNLKAEPPIKSTKRYFPDIITKEGNLRDYTIKDMASYLGTAQERVYVDYVLNNLPTSDEFINFITNYAHEKNLYKGELTTEQMRYAFYEYILRGGKQFVKEDLYAKWQNALMADIVKYNVLDNFKETTINTSIKASSYDYKKSFRDYKIVGFYIPNYYLYSGQERVVMLSNEDYNSINGIEGIYTNLLVPSNLVDINKVANLSTTKNGDVTYALYGTITPILNNADNTIKSMVPILSGVSIGLMIFSLLLLTNYLFVAMLDQNKEIGILKSFGASNLNVFSIYFIKSILLALIILIFSMVFTAVIGLIINVFAFSNITALVFGWRQFGVLLGVTVGASLLANILPICINIRKSPHELIVKK